MKHVKIIIFAFIITINGALYAEEVKPVGLDVAPNTVITILRKLGAFFTGNLEWTMSPDKNIKKDNYTTDPLGREVPRSTLKKDDLK